MRFQRRNSLLRTTFGGLSPLARIVSKLNNETRKHLLADQCPVWASYVNLTAPCQLMGLPVTCQDHPSLERSAVNLHRGDKSVFIKDAGSESLVDTRASSTGWWRKD